MSAVKNRKVVISHCGDISNLTIVTENLAAPERNHVQVNILYAGFSGTDINMRLGQYPMQKTAPFTPGYCFAGRVTANGPECLEYKPGDLVTAMTVYDSEAEYINIPEKYLIPIPEGVSLQQAAALCLDWTTAYGMVRRTAMVSQGQRVFIHGLSGAVGQALMMLSQLQGAIVYGTASERNHAALKEAGAHPFVYTNKDWIRSIQAIGGVHAVFDPLGFESLDESYSILSATDPSILVCYGNNLASLKGEKPRSVWPHLIKLLFRNLFFWSNKSTRFYFISRDQKTFQPEMLSLLDMTKNGRISPPIKQVWDMDDIKEAHQSWGKGPGMGSMLIRVSPEK